MPSSCLAYTYITFLQNRSEHDCFLQTDVDCQSKSQMIVPRHIRSTFAQSESLLQGHQNLDDAFPFTQRFERLADDRTQHSPAVHPSHPIPGR
jgi:hypothetical protein